MKLVTKIMIGLGAGIAMGLALTGHPEVAVLYVKPFGDLFLRLIKMTIVPLVFASLVCGAASIGDTKKLGRIAGKTLAYFFCTTAGAIAIGLLVANLIQPGVGANLSVAQEAVVEAGKAPTISETLLNIVPANGVAGLAEGNMLQIIFFALALGIGAVKVGEKGGSFLAFNESLAEIMYELTDGIMKLAPYGVFALIVPVIAQNGPSVLMNLLKVIGAAYVGFVVHAVIVYSLTVSGFAKVSPKQFFGSMWPAIMLAFSTSSSAGTLPLTMDVAHRELGVPDSIASFVLPLGTTINMDGTAIYQGVCAMFIAQAYGIDLSPAQQLTILLTAVLASVGTAGVPGSGFIMLTMVLTSVGLPLEGAALVGGIDRILDMGRTTVNITGDAACSVIVAATEGELDKSAHAYEKK